MRREWLYLDDAAEACRKVIRYVNGKSEPEFATDELVFDAVLHNIQIIGEAVRHLPDDVRALQPDIPWGRIVAVRNIVVHHYFGVDSSVIWSIATVNVPPLLEALEAILADWPENT